MSVWRNNCRAFSSRNRMDAAKYDRQRKCGGHLLLFTVSRQAENVHVQASLVLSGLQSNALIPTASA